MTGTNAESFSAPSFMTPFSLARRSRLIHLCNRFAFTPCESARLAIDTPGCKPASTLQCARCRKLSAYDEGVNLYNVSLYGAQYIHLRYGLIRPSPWLHRVRRLPRRKVWFCAGG